MSGTRLISGDPKFNTFKVQHIIENSPASDAGLREGLPATRQAHQNTLIKRQKTARMVISNYGIPDALAG